MEFLSSLVEQVRAACVEFPDARRGDVRYSMADIGLSAFSLFFMQSESFLSYQRGLEERRKASNCRTLFGMGAIPTDNHIRAMLDVVHPSHLQPAFDGVLDTMRRRDGFAPFRRLGGRVLIALDGAEYFCSQKLGCPQCLTRKRSNGRIESYHSMLCATVVAPGHAMALPLMPEFIAPQDGAEKQDCERNAVRRWLASHAARVKDLRPVFLGDDLFACQPVVDAMVAAGGDFLLTAKPTSHRALHDFMDGATPEERVLKQKAAGKTLTCRCRRFKEVPLRDGADSRLVDRFGVTVTDAKGKTTYANSFVTSLDVTRDSVAEIVACARARWKIENESFNVLKSNGYHLEHNFGHGQQNLAMMFAAPNMLAFAIHTVCDCLENGSGSTPGRPSAPDSASSSTSAPSRPTSCFPTGTPSCRPSSTPNHLPRSKPRSDGEEGEAGPMRTAGPGQDPPNSRSAPDLQALSRPGRAHEQRLRARPATRRAPPQVTNGYCSTGATEAEAAVRTMVSTDRINRGPGTFAALLQISTKPAEYSDFKPASIPT